MKEGIYRVMGQSGAIGITVGILMIVVGITSGVLSIVAGARVLHSRKDILL